MTEQVRYVPNPGGVDDLLHSPHGAYGVWLTRLGNLAVNRSKARCKVDTGLLRSSIDFRVEVVGGGIEGILAARTNYAGYVNSGTRFMDGDHFLTNGAAEALRQMT